jgi:hypothetical protein
MNAATAASTLPAARKPESSPNLPVTRAVTITAPIWMTSMTAPSIR